MLPSGEGGARKSIISWLRMRISIGGGHGMVLDHGPLLPMCSSFLDLGALSKRPISLNKGRLCSHTHSMPCFVACLLVHKVSVDLIVGKSCGLSF